MRALPPSGVPISISDVVSGFGAAFKGTAAIEDFKGQIATRFGVKHTFLASSGRAALSILLMAYGQVYCGRNEVLLPAYTSFSVPSAVVNAGMKVSLYDLDADTLSPDLESVQRAVTSRTLCIVVCHLYGFPCDMDPILAFAREKGIKVIDDAAQAMGAIYRGRQVGTIGDAGLFSLSRGKNITAVDGGIIVTNSDSLAEKLGELEPRTGDAPGTFGLACKALILSALLRPWLYWIPRRLPFLNLGASIFEPEFPVAPFTPFQAGIAMKMLGNLDKINTQRTEKALCMLAQLAEKHKGATIGPVERANPVYLRLPWIGGVSAKENKSLGVVRSYPLSLNEIPGLQSHLVNGGEYPVANMLAERLVTLPTHVFVRDEDQLKMAACL